MNQLQYLSILPENQEPHLSPAPLTPIFNPKSVAVIGATEKPASVGRTVLRNLLDQPFGATVFPVNPTHSSVLGVRCYPSVAA
ncbi:MAG TPA: CoA-binding protein, partial [Candidatus Angelobacter sp.]|nr:CoA-binding protein [Candidatus Angelobacter sp.]